MAGYLLDTNQLSEAVQPVSRVRERIAQARRGGARIGTCVPVLCELEAGLQRQERYRHTLHAVLHDIRIWPIDRETARLYGTIYIDLVRRGRVLAQVDIMLAALARQHGYTLITSDLDFASLQDLRIEDWTQPSPNASGPPA
jgi:tRNA(fMet)-specific endonuclease VapC